jgi:Rad3-related DNA helicase
MNLAARLEEFLKTPRPQEISDPVLALYFRVLSFLDAADRAGEKYVSYSEIMQDGRFRLRIFCVDPSGDLEECLKKGRAAVLFSATLLPVGYYKRLLSTREDDYAVYAASSFDPGRARILIGRDTSSRYTMRGPMEYRKMAEYIRRVVRAKTGNYMVFFSSYRMMEDVADVFSQNSGQAQGEEISMLLQKKRMSEKEREDFLLAFSKREKEDDNGVGIASGGKEREEIPPDRQRSQSAETP